MDMSTALLAPSHGEAAKGLSVLCPPCPGPTVCSPLDPRQPERREGLRPQDYSQEGEYLALSDPAWVSSGAAAWLLLSNTFTVSLP